MKGFQAEGSYKTGRDWQVFKIQFAAENADEAREKALSTLGSRHKVKRWEIKFDSLEEIPDDQITSLMVNYMVKGE